MKSLFLGNEMVSRYLKKCPACARLIKPAEIPSWEATGFDCPGCGKRLKNSGTVIKASALIALLLSLAFFRYLGYRGAAGIALGLLAFVPVTFALAVTLALIFPQRLELYEKPLTRRPPD